MDLSITNNLPQNSAGNQKPTPKSSDGPRDTTTERDAKAEIEIVFHGVVTKLILATEPAGQGMQTTDTDPPVRQQPTQAENKGALLDKNV